MEKTSFNTISPFSFFSCIVFLLCDLLLKSVLRFKKFYLSSQCFIQPQIELTIAETAEEEGLSREEVEMVMGKLALVCNRDDDDDDDETVQDKFGSSEFSVLFENKEPSVEEVKKAFEVFDENRDGFVDATELQRVLCSLGFREGSKVEECEKMIRAFDENSDGKIDFNEFVKLMENSLF